MTLEQFLELLESARWIKWGLIQGRIRGLMGCCPISALAPGGSRLAYAWGDAARQLNLEHDDIINIVNSADNSDDCDLTLRQRLLKACRLEESN